MDELIATLEREADERCEAIRADAEQQVERLRRAAEVRVEERRSEVRRRLETELQARDATQGAATRKKIRGVLLRARRSALDRVFRRAREMLPDAALTPEWEATVPEELRRALACLGDVDVDVTCPPDLGAAIRAAAESLPPSEAADRPDAVRRLHIVEREGAPPGFVLHGRVTEVEVDATLPTRLAAARPELAARVLRGVETSP
ncbi:MAG: V-type ATP synthase subunit E family protein [Gemmatimonadales bacterium]|jgi:vacuolar-type H+-ATPase subunit E/Vma4